MNVKGKKNASVVCRICENDLQPVLSDDPPVSDGVFPSSNSLDYLYMFTISFLQSANYNCSRRLVREHIISGYKCAHKVYTGGKFKNLQEICEFSWYLLSKACVKNCGFISGAWQLEDPNYILFNALGEFGYSRYLNIEMLPERIKFGSTHVLPYIQHCIKKGKLPEKDTIIELKNGKQSQGYIQIGIDIDPENDDDITLGLVGGKTHILVGKVPPKENCSKQYIFYKIENHGTYGLKNKLKHTIDLMEYLFCSNDDYIGSRRENSLNNYIKPFYKIIDLITNCNITELKYIQENSNNYKSNAKTIGLSFMIDCVKEIDKIIRKLLLNENIIREKSSNLCEIYLNLKKFEDIILSKPELDHLDIRFGEEVILSLEEILYKGYKHK